MTYPLHHAVYSSLIADPPKIPKQKKGSWDDRYERAIITRFCDFGFKEVIQDKTSKPYELKGNPGICDYIRWIEEGRKQFLPDNAVVHQPFSTFRPIDLASFENGRTFLTESKSSTDEKGSGSVQFNTSLPHPEIFYYLSNMIKCVLMRGFHILNEDEHRKFSEYEDKLDQIPRPQVEGFGSRIRVFYNLSSYQKIFDTYGPLCTQDSLGELMGKSPLHPTKRFQWSTSASLEEFLEDAP